MKGLKSQLLVIGCILACLCSYAWAEIPTLPYDQVVAGAISSPAQHNSYTFSANAGDVLNFTVVTKSSTSGTLGPCILLYDSNNNPVDSAGGGYNPDVEMNGYKVVLSGTYTVVIKDCIDSATGDYLIFLQKTNDPKGSAPLPYAQVVNGTISSAAQSNAYTLAGTKGDILNFTVVATSSTSGTLGPCILLYNTAGTPVLDSAGGGYNPDVEMNGYKVPATGTYNLLIKDCIDSATGDYMIFVQKTNDPIDSVPIVYGQIQPGNVGSAAQSNAYTLIGTMGDTLNFTVVTTKSTGGTLGPCILLYNTAGTPVLDSAGGGYNPDVEMNGYKVPANGTYNVFIKDCIDSATGNYTLSTECFGVCQLPVPVVTSISPTSALEGSGPLTLTVNGSGFANVESNSVVRWNDFDLKTTFVSTNQLTAAVPGTDTAAPGVFPVTVFTPAPGGGTSSPPVDFTVNSLGPLPTATPVFTPGGGTYHFVQLVAITDSTPRAVIYYTTDGSMPTDSSSIYTTPIRVTVSGTIIRAIAQAPGYAESAVAAAGYAIVGSPSALAAPATAVSTSDASLNAVVNTLGVTGSYFFQYGTSSTALTSNTPKTPLSASTAPVNVSAQLTGLAAKTTYYFQVVVTTKSGISSGAVLSFTTN